MAGTHIGIFLIGGKFFVRKIYQQQIGNNRFFLWNNPGYTPNFPVDILRITFHPFAGFRIFVNEERVIPTQFTFFHKTYKRIFSTAGLIPRLWNNPRNISGC